MFVLKDHSSLGERKERRSDNIKELFAQTVLSRRVRDEHCGNDLHFVKCKEGRYLGKVWAHRRHPLQEGPVPNPGAIPAISCTKANARDIRTVFSNH
ncbi:hypothetical protein BaRGS_00029574 [Batillaria attramentaria]|uniref:Uncharacterized protein n=1 Tax=Batillaria attramentaria TaxID=370345 RepID=A0ABD0JXC0_9CAEN